MRRRSTAVIAVTFAAVMASCANPPTAGTDAGGPLTSSKSKLTSRPAPTASLPESEPTSADSPSGTATSTAPTSTPTREPDSSPGRAREAQIPPGRLPGFNAEWRWNQTGRLRDLVSPCMRSTLVSIGAVKQVGRTFGSTAGAPTDEAAQLTGVFPDEHTAITSAAVLTAWHDNCAKAAADQGLKQVSVSRLRDVPTPVGTGHQWRLTYRPVPGQPNSAWFISQGFVRDGDTITLLVYRNAGQDYNYPVGSEPIDRALAVAGHYLASSR